MKKNLEKYIYICMKLNHFAVYLKLTQYCKPTKLQLKKKNTLISLSTIHPALPKPTGSHRARSALIWSTQGTSRTTTGQGRGRRESEGQTEERQPLY